MRFHSPLHSATLFIFCLLVGVAIFGKSCRVSLERASLGLIFWEATSLPTEQNQTQANVVSILSVKTRTLICLSDLFHWDIKGVVCKF